MLLGRGWLAAVLLCACDWAATPTWRVYRVQDEPLGLVARRTGVSVERLKSINHLTSDMVRWHQGLLVPDGPRTHALPLWRPALPAPAWAACPAVRWVPPEEATDPACQRKRCAGEACACARDDEGRVELSVGAAHWSAVLYLPLDPEGFLHAQVDLDGDGQPESVVLLREAVSNGIAVETWSVTVVARGAPVASFRATDFGDTFIAQPKGCALVAMDTEWRDDQLRGDGLYFTGQAHVLDGTSLRAVGPKVARRYTNRFSGQRWAALEVTPHRPLAWFTDPGAFVWADERTQGPCRRARLVSEDADGKLTLEGGEVLTLRRDDVAPPFYDALVDQRTGAPRLSELHAFGEVDPAGREVVICEGTRNEEPWVTVGLP